MSEINYLQRAQQDHMTFRVEVNEPKYREMVAGKKFDDDQEQDNAVHFKQAVEAELQGLHSEYKLVDDAYALAIADAKNSGDFAKADELRRERADLQEAYSMCVDRPPGMFRDGAEFADMWEDRLDALSDQISIGMNSLDGNPETTYSATGQVQHDVAPMSHTPTAIDAQGADASAGTEDASASTEGNEKGDWAPLEPGEVEELTELITRDPDAFMARLGEFSNEQRQSILTVVQQNLQQANQMFSMMSNFQKAMHDTQKAVINNFRV